MNMEFVSKYKWWILGGTLGLVATRLFTPQQTATNEAATSQAYDPALVSLGIQAGIEQDRMKLENAALVLESDTTRYIAGLAADTEVKLNASDNAATLAQMDTSGKYTLESMKLENQGMQMALDQQERLVSSELFLEAQQSAWGYALGRENINLQSRLADVNSHTTIEVARISGDSSVKAAKAGKSKSIGCCGFSLSI